MKKLLSVLIAVMLLVSCGVVTSAAEAEADGEMYEISSDVYENEEPAPDASNPFATAYEYVCAHADDIFSVLAFIGSLILALVYKKGLMPALSSALVNIRTSVKSIGDTAEKTLVGNETVFADIKEHVDLISTGLDKLCVTVAELDERLGASEEQANEAKAMKAIMSTQVDMLYNVFMSSSLPQYSKDAVGERISEMKAALAETVSENE